MELSKVKYLEKQDIFTVTIPCITVDALLLEERLNTLVDTCQLHDIFFVVLSLRFEV